MRGFVSACVCALAVAAAPAAQAATVIATFSGTDGLGRTASVQYTLQTNENLSLPTPTHDTAVFESAVITVDGTQYFALGNYIPSPKIQYVIKSANIFQGDDVRLGLEVGLRPFDFTENISTKFFSSQVPGVFDTDATVSGTGTAKILFGGPQGLSLVDGFPRFGEIINLTSMTLSTSAPQSCCNFAVPEPDSWALMTVGFFGFGAVLRRARARAVRGLDSQAC